MNIQNLPTLKIHKLTQEQYDREYAAGNLDPNALYLTPDEGADLPFFVQEEEPVDAEEGAIWVDTNEEALNLSGLLPEVDADDNGKTIKVINGYWQLTDAASGIDQTARDAAAAAQLAADAKLPLSGGRITGPLDMSADTNLRFRTDGEEDIRYSMKATSGGSFTIQQYDKNGNFVRNILQVDKDGNVTSGLFASEADFKDEIDNRKIKTYYSLSHLGLSGAVTTSQVFSAMPKYSKFIFVNNKNNTNHISDISDVYTIVELNRSSEQGKGSYVNYSSTSLSRLIVKECSWFNGATFAGWFPIMTAAGGTFTGAVTLSGDPSANLQAATKQYVDNKVSAVSTSAAMPKSGGTFTGNVVAYSTNRSGASVRNITVQNSSGTNLSTN